MDLTFYRPGDLPAEWLSLWRERVQAGNPAMALTFGPEWFAMMAGEKGERGAVAVCRSGEGAPEALLPVLSVDWPLHVGLAPKLGVTRRLSVLKVHPGYFLAPDLPAARVAQLFTGLLDSRPQAAGILFDYLPQGEKTMQVVEAAGHGRPFFLHWLFRDMPHYRLALPATLEECLRSRSAKSLGKIRGREAALAKAAGGAVRTVEIRGEPDWLPFKARVESLVSATWQARWLGRQFRWEDLAEVARRGWLRSFLLTAGDRVAAYAICYQGMETMVYEIIGYDPAFARFSPGISLLYRIIEAIYQRDTPKYLDFGEGEAEYKKQLANDVVSVGGCLVVRRRPALRLWFGAHRVLRSGSGCFRATLAAAGIGPWLARRAKRGAGR